MRAFFIDLDEQFPGLDLQLINPLAEGSERLAASVAGDVRFGALHPYNTDVWTLGIPRNNTLVLERIGAPCRTRT